MFEEPWPRPSRFGAGTEPDPCPECGAPLALCEVECQNAVVRVWSFRRELQRGVSVGRFTSLERGALGPSSEGQPVGEFAPALDSRWQTTRVCPGCGLLWLRVETPEALRVEQPAEVVPSEAPGGRGSEVSAAGEE
jgi:hypothetical protein